MGCSQEVWVRMNREWQRLWWRKWKPVKSKVLVKPEWVWAMSDNTAPGVSVQQLWSWKFLGFPQLQRCASFHPLLQGEGKMASSLQGCSIGPRREKFEYLTLPFFLPTAWVRTREKDRLGLRWKWQVILAEKWLEMTQKIMTGHELWRYIEIGSLFYFIFIWHIPLHTFMETDWLLDDNVAGLTSKLHPVDDRLLPA